MTRTPPPIVGRLVLAAGLALLLFPCGAAAEDEDDPFEMARTAFMAAETPQEKLDISLRFLAGNPDHERFLFVVDVAAGVMADEMDDRRGAVDFVRGHLAGTADAQSRQDYQAILMDLFSAPGYGDELRRLVDDRYDPATTTYVEHLAILEAATAAEAWALVDEHAAAAAPQATPEAFRAAYPDRGFSDERIETAGRNRQGLLKTFTGWSAAKQGDTKRALAEFGTAAKLVSPDFFGLPSNELYRYWGRTLVAGGELDEGLEKLVLADIFGADDEAGADARRVYTDLGRDEDDYDDFRWKMRRKHAVDMVDFKATDYDGVVRSFNELRGEKATLLAFWFPT